MPDTRYQLYYSPGACSLASHIALEELDADYEATSVVIADGAHLQPMYLAVNPRGRVPSLVIRDGDGERVLTETTAILVYLAQQYPDRDLLPLNAGDGRYSLARALEWIGWLGANVHQGTTRGVIRPGSFTDDESAFESVRAKGRERARVAFADIDERLARSEWALGNRFSFVDAYLLVFYRWGGKCGFVMRDMFPHFTRVMDAVRARPAARKVVAQQGIQIE